MGFVRGRKTFRLVFEGELQGLEVIATSSGVDDYLMISELANVTFPLTGADVTRFKRLLKSFADVLVEWNLESAPGVAVPATREGLGSQDPEFVAVVIAGWMDAISGAVTAEPGFSEESLPMEALT